MVLIVGGRKQGKLEYALKKYNLNADEAACELGSSKIVCGLQDIIKTLVSDGEDAVLTILRHAEKYPDTIYISDEVGCGVVPIDPFEREWREAVGRTCVALAERAEEVERIFCGLPMKLKDGRSIRTD